MKVLKPQRTLADWCLLFIFLTLPFTTIGFVLSVGNIAGGIMEMGIEHDYKLCGFDHYRLVVISKRGLNLYVGDSREVYCDLPLRTEQLSRKADA